MRYLTGNTHPHPDTLCTFRRNHQEAIAAALLQVRELARELKRLKRGTVSLDGTLIRAHASKDKNLTCPRAQPLRLPWPQEVQALLAQAEQADPREEDPQRLPEELARRQALRKKMDEACARREARVQARAEAEKAQARRPRAQPQPREGRAQGPSSKPPPVAPAPEAQIHLTDPDLRLMRKNRRGSYSQGYNAQVVVDAEGSPWIVGQRVSDSATDAGQWEPGLQSIPQELGQPTAVLADCGYASKEDFQRLGRQRPGLAVWECALGGGACAAALRRSTVGQG